jgi:CHAT domain-containing protein/tetratricopeptide (TPR) repeat protein
VVELGPRATESSDALVRRLIEQPASTAEVVDAWLRSRDPTDEDLLVGLKNESERLLVIDTAAAETLANALVMAADRLDSPRYRALGWIAQGDVRRAQGRYAEAVALMEAAGQQFLALGDEVGWARSRIGWVFASQFCGRGPEAIPVAEQAYVILARAGEHLRAGSLSTNTAGVYHHLGQYERALDLYDRAICHFQQVRPYLETLADERIAKAMANKALALMLLGRFDEAIDLCEAARDIFMGCDELASALRVDHFRASIYAGQGQYTRALRVHAEALAAFEKAGLHESAVQVTLDMIDCQAGLNRHADALALAEDLTNRCEAAGAPTQAARARFRAARALAALGQPQSALRALASANELLSAGGLTAELGSLTLLRARLQLDESNWEVARALADQAFGLFAERGLVERRTQAELVRAQAALDGGLPDEAERLAESALHTSRALDALPLSHAAHHVLARVAEHGGHAARALAEYEAAVRDLEQVQSSLATELRIDYLGDKLRLFHDAIDFCIAHNQLERGLDYLERAKSRALVDYLAAQPEVSIQARSPAERELIDQLHVLREEHNWFYSRLHGADPAGMSEPVPEPERVRLQHAVADSERRIMKIHERLALLRDSEGLESIGPRPSVHVDPVPSVEPGTLLLEYVFREDRGAVFVVTPSGLRAEPLTIGASGLQRLLNRWYLNLDAAGRSIRHHQSLDRYTQNANGLLKSLYDALLRPVAEYLDDARHVIVVPYGPTHGVPFHALFDGARYLAERVEVWTTPSSSLLRLCAKRARRDLTNPLVVGYSGGRLDGVLDEVRRVSRLLGGVSYVEREATRRVVLAEAPRHRVVHLAAHGEARLDNPTFAHLSMADGQLGMADIVTIQLDGALVTLSACETGRTAVVGGDELVGLSRGFLFAGASTLIQSLWRVDDTSTVALMEGFYTGLLAGLTPGAALRRTQRRCLESGAHPYVWAPFQVVGYGG